jgi:hypothetical protein
MRTRPVPALNVTRIKPYRYSVVIIRVAITTITICAGNVPRSRSLTVAAGMMSPRVAGARSPAPVTVNPSPVAVNPPGESGG